MQVNEYAGYSNNDFLRSGGAQGSEELGKNQFLELMLAQVENQNPLEPTDNQEFVAQLAQFSSLEGIENLNESIGLLSGDFRSNLALQAGSLVGRSVLVPTDQTLMSGKGIVGDIGVPSSASSVSVSISDAFGNPVKTLELGSQKFGAVRFTWNGLNEQGEAMEPGIYRIHASASIGGEIQEVPVDLPEQVVSVSLTDQGIRLNLSGGNSVAIGEVKEIQ
ncbi:MAG: flagellar hook assembly protein FlgD [Pseudomonadales bacterium]|nr:flagellar hook assembly protein FlgD [Pseudomonadales bacterium]